MANSIPSSGLERILQNRTVVLASAGVVVLAAAAAIQHRQSANRRDSGIESGISQIDPNSLYIVQPANGSNIVVPITPDEARIYSSNVRQVSEEPKVLYAGSGGGIKGLFGVGFLTELREHITIDHHNMTSAHTLDAVSSKLSPSDYEEFAVEVPDMFEPLVSFHARHLKPLQKLEMLKRIYLTEEVDLGGRIVETPAGIYSTEKLEEMLKQIFGPASRMDVDAKNYTIMATSYDQLDGEGRPKPVALGIEYPEMPVPTAILSAIAMERFFRFQRYDGHLLGDAGPVYHFPLSEEHLKDFSTVIGVDLGARNFTAKSRLPDDLARELQEDHEYNNQRVMEIMRNPDIGKVAYIAPYIPGIAPSSIKVSKKRRREFIAEGKKAADEFLNLLRRPMVGVSYNAA